ncbi:MAG: RdgB/HAM1 family non-canonical purine NTP pyrophosphatase [Chloroflexota bacterium]
MPPLLLATNNPGKVAEFRNLLDGCGWELVTPAEIGVTSEPEETGATYEDNARIKALAGMRASGLVTLADDSGLEVQAMGGEPGVQAARFLGAGVSFAERFAEIERRLDGLPLDQRTCRFVAVIAIADPKSGEVQFSEGEIRGLIASAPRGDGGFGYDPIFWSPEQSATFGELPEHEKAIISHRARAAAGARQTLLRLLYDYQPASTAYSRLP